MNKILLVEDDENFGSLLQNYLKISGYEVTWCSDGAKGFSRFKQETFDLIILDVMMPNMDGFSLAEKIKKDNPTATPLFFLTAKQLKEDIIKGYSLGADDYLTKPFDTEILLLKIKAILHRNNANHNLMPQCESYEIGSLIFTPSNRYLSNPQTQFEHKLSPKESALLALLCEYQNNIMPREVALNQIWKENNYFTKRSMDVYINKLRKILKIDPRIKIETFHQMGFQLMLD